MFHFVDTGSRNDELKSVVVYIHGESFEWNSGNAYDGTIFASYTDTVFISVNYRLGRLGE